MLYCPIARSSSTKSMSGQARFIDFVHRSLALSAHQGRLFGFLVIALTVGAAMETSSVRPRLPKNSKRWAKEGTVRRNAQTQPELRRARVQLLRCEYKKV